MSLLSFTQLWPFIVVIMLLLASQTPVISAQDGGKDCDGVCATRQQQRLDVHGTDLLDVGQLLTKVKEAREAMYDMLKKDYGEKYFNDFFFKDGVSRGTSSWFSAGEGETSINRFRRKLKMKILQMQINLLGEEKDIEGCDCAASLSVGAASSNRERKMMRTRVLTDTPTDTTDSATDIDSFFNRFVWATGGHSAAAAHGNLYNESYTAYMTRAVEPIFAAAGIDFEGRNYAMGGMSGAPEVAMCNEAIFGTDADVISWDFGMTDGRAFEKTLLYASRSGVHRNRPMHVSMVIDGRGYQDRIKQIKKVEEQGLPAMMLQRTILGDVSNALPDMFGMTEADAQALPPFVRDFKCEGNLEKGDPSCGLHKYNDDICPGRKFKASWHPGW